MIIDFTEPKKVKDILEQIDGSLSEEGQAMLFAKLVLRYDQTSHERMKKIEDNFIYQEEKLNKLIQRTKHITEVIDHLEKERLNAK